MKMKMKRPPFERGLNSFALIPCASHRASYLFYTEGFHNGYYWVPNWWTTSVSMPLLIFPTLFEPWILIAITSSSSSSSYFFFLLLLLLLLLLFLLNIHLECHQVCLEWWSVGGLPICTLLYAPNEMYFSLSDLCFSRKHMVNAWYFHITWIAFYN